MTHCYYYSSIVSQELMEDANSDDSSVLMTFEKLSKNYN